jgi:hypothetical protein
VSEYNEIHVRDYIDRVIRELKADVAEAAALAVAGERDRVRTTLDAMNRRLDELNNFKQALAAQTRDFPTREVIDEMRQGIDRRADEREQRIRHLEQEKADTTRVKADEDRISLLENFASNMKGRITTLGAVLLVLQGIVGVIIYVLSRHP